MISNYNYKRNSNYNYKHNSNRNYNFNFNSSISSKYKHNCPMIKAVHFTSKPDCGII